MLIELAIADAYGAGFEYVSERIIKQYNTLECYRQHPRHLSIKPGQYTDDTQMSIAIAELLVSDQEWTKDNLAHYFVTAFKRDPREGYAGRFYEFLQSVTDGTMFLQKILPHSEKSGAAMRAAPIGILKDTQQVIDYASIQASVTHDTAVGINSAIVAALMSHYFIYQLGPIASLQEFLAEYVASKYIAIWPGTKVGPSGLDAVRAAMTAVMEEKTLKMILQRCIAFSGDADTVATIAIGAACCAKGIENDLPAALYDNLEDGQFGLKYLQNLNQQFWLLKGK